MEELSILIGSEIREQIPNARINQSLINSKAKAIGSILWGCTKFHMGVYTERNKTCLDMVRYKINTLFGRIISYIAQSTISVPLPVEFVDIFLHRRERNGKKFSLPTTVSPLQFSGFKMSQLRTLLWDNIYPIIIFLRILEENWELQIFFFTALQKPLNNLCCM